MNFIKAVNGMFLKQVLTSLFRINMCTGHSKLALFLNTEEISLLYFLDFSLLISDYSMIIYKCIVLEAR